MRSEELIQLPESDRAELFRYCDGRFAAELLGAAFAGLGSFTWLAKTPADLKRTGKPALWSSRKDQKPWAEAMTDSAFAEQFTEAMDARGMILGPALARWLELKDHCHLLDIAGSSGIYACSIVATHARLKATMLERPPVDRVARECIARRGYSSRVDVAAGDMFADPFLGECDVHLFSNVLHDWDSPEIQKLLSKSFRVMLLKGNIPRMHRAVGKFITANALGL